MSNNFIKHITIENYKSIKKLDLELKPLNVLIGRNGAGKSNFISFFNLIQNIIKENLRAYVLNKGGQEIFLHYCSKFSKFISAKINFQIVYEEYSINNLLNYVSPQYDLVTTLLDLVALDAAKIYNYSNIMKDTSLSPQDKATKVESNITETVNYTNIIPYVQPHEFEALCFGDIEGLAESDPLLFKHKSKIEQILRSHNNNPEHINTIPSSYPAKRLERLGYTKYATNFAQYCRIETIKSCCPHFDYWLAILIKNFR